MTTYDIKMRVGLRIKELRAKTGLSQQDFAYHVGMAQSYFAEVETGKRNVAMVNFEKIVNGLGVTFEEFFHSDYFN